MIHHGCEHETEDKWYNQITGNNNKATMAVMGYDGRYRCGECKRRVAIEVSDETYENDLEMLPKAEPPYPDGWCGPKPESEVVYE